MEAEGDHPFVAPEGGIQGVHSLSDAAPLKRTGFAGYCWAWAVAQAPNDSSAHSAARRIVFIFCSSMLCWI